VSEIANTIFSPELAARFDKLVTIYPLKRSALVPMLLYAQDEVGYVSDAVVTEIAGRLDLLELDVRNVLSYYSMLRTKPAGKYNVQVCTNISCMLRGGYEILNHCKHNLALGIRRRPGTASFRSKRSSASAPAAGLLRSRSTTTFTRTLHRRSATLSFRCTATARERTKNNANPCKSSG
jgi:NADH:ubiquinone oxidoreductase subunit E